MAYNDEYRDGAKEQKTVQAEERHYGMRCHGKITGFIRKEGQAGFGCSENGKIENASLIFQTLHRGLF